MQTVGEAVGSPLLQAKLLPAILAFGRDPVPNLRFNVAKALERLLKNNKLDAVTKATVVLPALQSLSLDPDDDVKYYAAKALNTLHSLEHAASQGLQRAA